MSKEAIKRFLIETPVENAEGSQTWYVDATSEAEALKKYEQGGCDLYASNVDVTSLGKPEISGETTLDDFGDFAEQPAQQEPVALKWQQAPIRTAWGDDMVVASVAIDKDHTVCLYCERDQTPKVDAMFAQRTWVHATEWRGLTDEEIENLIVELRDIPVTLAFAIEAKLRSKNEDRN